MRYWVFSRKARIRLTTFGVLALIAILVAMAARVVPPSAWLTHARENLPIAPVPANDATDEHPIAP